MKDTFDLRKFLTENKLTTNSKKLNEESSGARELRKFVEQNPWDRDLPKGFNFVSFLNKLGLNGPEDKALGKEMLKAIDSFSSHTNAEDFRKAIKKITSSSKQDSSSGGKTYSIGGQNYTVGEDDPNDIGTITDIRKFSNGYFITGTVYNDAGEEIEGYGYAIDFNGEEIDEDDLNRFSDRRPMNRDTKMHPEDDIEDFEWFNKDLSKRPLNNIVVDFVARKGSMELLYKVLEDPSKYNIVIQRFGGDDHLGFEHFGNLDDASVRKYINIALKGMEIEGKAKKRGEKPSPNLWMDYWEDEVFYSNGKKFGLGGYEHEMIAVNDKDSEILRNVNEVK